MFFLTSRPNQSIRVAALLIEGRFLEAILKRSEAWRPAAAARNQSPGRPGTPPARHYDLAARSSLHGSGGNAGDGSTGPRPKIATVERREARVPRWGREAPRKRLACRVMRHAGVPRWASRVSRRSATPRRVAEGKVQNPGATRRGNERVRVGNSE